MEKSKFQLLIDKYLDGQISEAEKAELFRIYQAYQNKDLQWDNALMDKQSVVEKKLLNKINNEIDALQNAEAKKKKPYYLHLIKYAAAVAVLVMLATGSYFFLKKEPVKKIAIHVPHDVLPGGNKAILTLANGQQVVLTGAQKGQIATQGIMTIHKTADGMIEYLAGSDQPPANPDAFNTISTPRGGQFWVTLPDGSKIFLNAASTLKYPVVFDAKERKVTLTGEAYFDVVHDSKQPFMVIAAGQIIKDVGTHFNINAYHDEPIISTTVSQGRVSISNAQHQVLLSAGEQAQVKNSDRNAHISIKTVDIEEALAWKDGRFVFDNENIHSIMRKLARWYDIEPEYVSNLPEIGFGGSVSRNKNISEVLKVLELTQAVHFKIDGRRVRIMP